MEESQPDCSGRKGCHHILANSKLYEWWSLLDDSQPECFELIGSRVPHADRFSVLKFINKRS